MWMKLTWGTAEEAAESGKTTERSRTRIRTRGGGGLWETEMVYVESP